MTRSEKANRDVRMLCGEPGRHGRQRGTAALTNQACEVEGFERVLLWFFRAIRTATRGCRADEPGVRSRGM